MKHTFIKSTATVARELLARFTDAKVRMSLYGTDEVVRNLSRFEELGGQLDSKSQEQAFISLIQSMRKKSKLKGTELEHVLFGP